MTKYNGTQCPLCGGSDIVVDQPEFNGASAQLLSAENNCENCGATWTELFELMGFINLKDETDKLVLFKVVEHFNGYAVVHVPSGQEHWLGDGVDSIFDDNDESVSPGTKAFVQLWEDDLNASGAETLEAYFPDLLHTEEN